MLRACFLLIIAALISAEKVTFDNYKVFRILPQNEKQLNLLNTLESFPENDLSFWKHPSHVNNTVDLMVAPSKINLFHDIMSKNAFHYHTYVSNVQTLIDNENPKSNVHVRKEGYAFDRYYRLEEMYQHLETLEQQYAANVEIVVAGKTYENREIRGVKLSYGENKPAVFIEGGIHAREWIGPATVMYLISQFLTSKDPQIRALAEAYDWYFFPSVNPDGYVYSHDKNRLWRKTRTPYGLCTGTDPNRNWDYKWMQGGASSNPCAETFAGSAPFSDIETKTLSEYIQTLQGKLFAYLSFHSYSQLLMFPYGYTTQHLENYDELYKIGKKSIQALAKRYGTEYETGNIAETIYIASGSSLDWVKAKVKVPIVYTYEFRDKGRHGFLLPANQIIPNGEEVMDSLIAMFDEAKKFGYPKQR